MATPETPQTDKERSDQYKLFTMNLNIVREDTNIQIRYLISDLLDDQGLITTDPWGITPSLYTWANLKETLDRDFGGFDESRDEFSMDAETYKRYDLQDVKISSKIIKDQASWERFLVAVTNSTRKHRHYTDLFFLLKAGEIPDDWTEQEKADHISWVCGRTNFYDVTEADLTVDYDPDAGVTYGSGSSSPIVHVVETRRDSISDVSESDLTEPWAPAPESPASAADSSPKAKKLPVRPGGRPLKRAAWSANVRSVSQVSLMDDRTEYETENAQDDDYGVLDSKVVDSYVGSFNGGGSDRVWRATLEFFGISYEEWQRGEDMRNKAGDRKRVPMKKLPGMSVGLFDYQLVGVLNLLKFILHDVSGGLLADEQGLGKTQEMFGLIALGYGLRKNKAEVKQAWKSGTLKGHHAKGNTDAGPVCPADKSFGFRCYCYYPLTQKLADLLPEGPNLIVAPDRGCNQIFEEAKSKLDIKTLKVRVDPSLAASAPDKSVFKGAGLTPAEVEGLAGKIIASGEGDEVKYNYQPSSGQSDWVIICTPSGLSRLVNPAFIVEVKVPGKDKPVKKSALMPGMVLMDEFHEYTTPKDANTDSPTIKWLKHQKDSRKLAPLVYFASGTPFGESPADIRPAIDLFARPSWNQKDDHFMNGASLSAFDELIKTYHKHIDQQNNGEILEQDVVDDYGRSLQKFLRGTMVRRLGIDKFRDRNLIDIGPLKVKISDHPLPQPLLESLQALADETRAQAEEELAQHHPGKSLGIFLRSARGEDILLKLRLSSTFPGISTTTTPFDFTPSEITANLLDAAGDLTKTAYYQQIPMWAYHSPKLETITKIINTMISDKSTIPGSSSNIKKLILFSPSEAESMLLYGYLLLLKKKNKEIKPTWINSVNMTQPDRAKLIKKFLEPGNAPPNILVAPMSLAGTGLNLQKAKYSIVTSPAWTKRDNQQAYYRTHRHGQTQETQLSLLTARWNPAERVILRKYEGKEVVGEEVWRVGGDHAGVETGRLVDRHQSGAATPISPRLADEE